MNRIEEVKKILQTNTEGGYFLRTEENFNCVARQIDDYYCRLFPQPLTDKELREKIADKFRAEIVTIGISVEDAKTGQMWGFDAERLSRIALALLQPKIEEAKREERERVKTIIQDWDKWVNEEGGEEKWQAKYGCDTIQLVWVIEQALEKGESE